MERHAIMNRLTSGSLLARHAAQPANCGTCPARAHCLPTGMNDTYCAAIDSWSNAACNWCAANTCTR